MKRKRTRVIPSLAVLMLAFLVAGGIFSIQVQAENDEKLDESLKVFTRLLDLVEDRYATEVDANKVIQGAIEGMLRTLDPHSKFFDADTFRQLREDQRGKYYGLGITVTSRFGKVTVVSPPFLGSPAEKVGLRVGDVISHVNGEPTEGWDLTRVVSHLKGPKGTAVDITIARPGVDERFDVSLIRGEIAKFTISNAFEVRPRIGYIKIDNFAETTGVELREALRNLDYKSLEGLVLDLRNNPGGLLQEAIEVSEQFLQKEQMIVETRGRTRGSNRPYRSQRANKAHLYPLVIVINKQSASASEIVAGAVQDHDRGLIVGEISFGKGLVQSVFPLSQKAGLALTTQKWYTPSGRLIQRDYSEVSYYDYYNRRPTKQDQAPEIRYSDLGRVVHSGGGIAPDHFVPEAKLSETEDSLIKRFAFVTFVRELLSDTADLDLSFQVTNVVVADFKKHLKKRDIDVTDTELEHSREFITRMIRHEITYNRFGVSQAARILLDGDPQILKAVELMPEAKELSVRARRRMAGRPNE